MPERSPTAIVPTFQAAHSATMAVSVERITGLTRFTQGTANRPSIAHRDENVAPASLDILLRVNAEESRTWGY
jgi:hypothetical protein